IERGAPSLREQRPDLPRGIVSCVDRALSVAPGRRPTAAGLAGSLREAAGQLPRRRPAARKGPHLRLAAAPLPARSLPRREAVGGAARIGALGVPGTESLLAAGRALGRELEGDPQLLALACALALGAVALPLVRGRGPLAAAAYGLVVGGLTVAVPPYVTDVP